MTGLRDTVVVVTGAAKGTGRVHCQRFADEGADVIALDAPAVADELADTAEKVADRGRRCVTGLADVTDLRAVTAAIDAGVAELGRLDTIVANAGVHLPGAPSWELDPLVWQRTLDINLTGVWHTVRAGVPHIGSDGGSIVIISSTSGLRGLPNTAHYTASKHAVVGLARTLANELGPRGIRVNTAPRPRRDPNGAQRGHFSAAATGPGKPDGGRRRRGAAGPQPASGAVGRARRHRQRRAVPGLG